MATDRSNDLERTDEKPRPGDLVLCACCRVPLTPYRMPYPLNEQLCDACVDELEEMRREGDYP
ncbi:hypothetical protein OR214_04584 [Ralstonia pickettii OR214]|jgi:hypothetical protein|uniref:Uncharacterized protein n=1 Tax=Ralstonia pickettii OR214 TaxID=1264675 RepID=R0E0B4_RALPI|nr:hypothetical protein OR214_04584 [Ralstonia pickettii OR214]